MKVDFTEAKNNLSQNNNTKSIMSKLKKYICY